MVYAGCLADESATVSDSAPTTAGIYSFTITAKDANGCQVSQDYTVVTAPPLSGGIPTLSGWAMIMFGALLALLALAAIRRLAT